jgi:chaperonin GroES
MDYSKILLKTNKVYDRGVESSYTYIRTISSYKFKNKYMKIKPLHNHVVIKQQDETETMYGNIIVPDAGKEKPLMGEVIASGPGVVNMNGIVIPNTTEVGATVIFPSFGGQRITVDGEEYVVCKEQDLIAILEK